MKKYLNKNNNNEELSEMQSNTYSNMNINYNSLSTNPNINQSYNDNNDININDENIDNTNNNIESEFETDLKKYAKTLNTKNVNINKSIYTNNKQEEKKKVNLIENYLIKLKNWGYPEMGKIYLSPDLQEQEKTFNFFEYIVKKETVNMNNKEKYQKKYEDLEFNLKNLKQELNNEMKSNSLIQKDL